MARAVGQRPSPHTSPPATTTRGRTRFRPAGLRHSALYASQRPRLVVSASFQRSAQRLRSGSHRGGAQVPSHHRPHPAPCDPVLAVVLFVLSHASPRAPAFSLGPRRGARPVTWPGGWASASRNAQGPRSPSEPPPSRLAPKTEGGASAQPVSGCRSVVRLAPTSLRPRANCRRPSGAGTHWRPKARPPAGRAICHIDG